MDLSLIPQYVQFWKNETIMDETEHNTIFNEIINLSSKQRYKIDDSSISGSLWTIDNYIKNIVQNYIKTENFTFISNENDDVHTNYNIKMEYYVWNNTSANESYFEYDKENKSSPLFSVIIPWKLTSKNNFVAVTDLDLETYKYKELPEDTSIVFSSLCEKNYIVIDGTKYCRLVSSSDDDVILKINVWKSDCVCLKTDCECIKNDNTLEKEKEKVLLTRNCNIIRESIRDGSFYEKFIYDEELETTTTINNLLSKQTISDNDDNIAKLLIVTMKNQTKYDLSLLSQKYGDEMAKDIFPFVNADVELDKENRFYRNKIVPKILSMDVCYWMINESHKKNEWEQSSNQNFDQTMNIENLPSVFNYIMFVSNFWLDHVKKLYSITNINLNIREIFIAKYTNEHPVVVLNEYNNDETFLSVQVQLNDVVDFRHQGAIRFENENEPDDILIQQGDMFVYNGLRPRTNGGITEGEKIVLVFLIDIMV